MTGRIAICAALLGAVVAAAAAPAGSPGAGVAIATAAGGVPPLPAQYRDGGSGAGRESLFEAPNLSQPGSLFRPRSRRLGPHYEPPAVVYEPPPVVYEPPSVTDRPSSRGDRGLRGRCAPRTRAWYDYCAARFRSFDPNRGTFTTFSGQERPCRCP